MSLRTPSVLADRYELGAVLGAGGMAQVHQARDVLLGRDVAVKIFRLDVEGSDLRRIEQETQTLARLNHPGLVAVYDAGGFAVAGADPTPYLVMELVDGPTWAQCCMDGSLGPERVLRLGAEIAETLAYVHAQGVVHRDVKPANILLAPGDRPKLADFGVALLTDTARHTQTGMTIGTAPYLSPEQVLGAPVGPPADVYSLGLVLLEALTGRREYPGSSTETALARLHRQPDVPVTSPRELQHVLQRMLAKDAADRPGAREVAVLLRSADGTAEAPTAATATASPPTRVLTRVVATPLGVDGQRPALVERSGPAGDVPEPRRRVAEPRRSVAAPRRSVGAEVLRDSLRSAPVLAAAGVLVVLLVLTGLLVARSGDGDRPDAPAPPGQAPASQLEQDLAELRESVTP